VFRPGSGIPRTQDGMSGKWWGKGNSVLAFPISGVGELCFTCVCMCSVCVQVYSSSEPVTDEEDEL